MTHRSRLLALALLAAAALSLLLLREGRDRAEAPARPAARDNERLIDLPPELPPEAPTRSAPAVLRGRVFGLGDAPVAKAEVAVLVPKTYDLVRTDEDGSYELRFERAGRHLVEASVSGEYAPKRVWIDVPAEGDPAPLDFHLEAAGTLFGEVTMDGLPVAEGGVDLYAPGDGGAEKLVSDTTVRDGYFSFPFAPPSGIPLRVDATSDDGFLPEPRFATFRGERLDLGRLELVRYPTLKFRMRLPDGRVADDVRVVKRDLIWVDVDTRLPRITFWPKEHSRLIVPERHDVTLRLLFASLDGRLGQDVDIEEPPLYVVEREVPLAVGQPKEIELVVKPGPFPVTSRLVDGTGRPQQARIALGTEETRTAPDGTFTVIAPHGGLVTPWLLSWDVPGHGWFDLDPRSDAHALLLDADDPATCRLDLDARIVAFATAPCRIELESDPPGPGSDNQARWWWSPQEPAGRPVACISRALHPGAYVWKAWQGGGPGTPTAEGRITVKKEGFAVLDLR